MGTWALFLVVTTIFETTKSYLLKNAHIKYVSGDIEGKEKTAIASSSLLINGGINILFIIFILLFSNYLSVWLHAGQDLANMLKWYIPGLVCMVFFSHFEAIQQSHFDFKGVFAGYFVRQAIFFGIIFSYYILKIPFSLPQLALYQSISVFFGSMAIFIYSRKYLLYRFDPSKKWIKKIFGYGGYIFGSGIMVNVFANLDQIITAKFMTSNSFVASYNAANRINGFIDIPSYAAAEILFPKLSHTSVEEGPGRVKYLYERMVGILLSFTVPAALFIMLFPDFVISLIAGSRYADAAFILQLYMIAGILRPAQNQAANLITSIGKSKFVFIANTIYLLVNLIIDYLCLLQFGFYGPAIGTVITCLLGLLAWYMIMRKEIGLELHNIVRYMFETYKTLYGQAIGFLFKRKPIQVKLP
jgi:lipopolysaccharide exporter